MGRSAIRSTIGIIFGVAFSTISFAAPVLEWIPVRVNGLDGTYTINGSDVTILELSGGMSIELELRINGWGSAAGSPSLGAYGATLNAPALSGEVTAPLRIKGWPSTPQDGAYIITDVCSVSGDPCSPPFDVSCGSGAGGVCEPNPNYVLPGSTAGVFFPPDGGSDLLYTGWGGSARTDDGQSYHAGYLVLEPTGYAEGSWSIDLSVENGESFLTSADGIPIAGLTVIPAVVTFRSGMCCWSPTNESRTRCENLMGGACDARPGPRVWSQGSTCPAECACPSCSSGGDCNDADWCTDDICEPCSGICSHSLNYDPAVECCDSNTGVLTLLGDGNECTLDSCLNGQPVYSPVCDDGNVCTLAVPCDPDPGCRFQTPAEANISCTTSATCPPQWFCNTSLGRCDCTEPSEPVTGKCCWRDLGGVDPNRLACTHGITSSDCFAKPGAVNFVAGEYCIGPCPCQDCAVDSHCDDGDPCTAGVCINSCSCEYVPSYDVSAQCCDSATGELTPLDDGNPCTRDDCGATPGTTVHTVVTAMPCDVQDRCAFATCSDAGVCAGVWPEDAPIACTQDPDCPEGWQCNTESSLCYCIFDQDALKNRYITFQPSSPGLVAYEVSLASSTYFPNSTGVLGWVGQPSPNRIAGIVPDPYFSDTWPSKVHVGDCRIVPVATYEVRDSFDGTSFGIPVVVETIHGPGIKYWGDCVGDFNGTTWTPPNGVTNINDALAAIKTFQAGSNAAPLTWTDIEPETLNRIVNFNDVYQFILAFTGEPYPFSDPANCP